MLTDGVIVVLPQYVLTVTRHSPKLCAGRVGSINQGCRRRALKLWANTEEWPMGGGKRHDMRADGDEPAE